MDEQKRLLLAVLLSVVVLVGYQFFFTTPPADRNLPQNTQESSDQPRQPATGDSQSTVSDYNRSDQGIPAPSPQPSAADFRTISVSTPLYNIAISEHLAAVTTQSLKQYKSSNGSSTDLKQMVDPRLPRGTLITGTQGGTIQGLDNAVFSADTDTTNLTLGQGEKAVAFSWTSPHGITVKKIYRFQADTYLIDCNIVIQNGSGMPLNDALVITTPGIFDEETKKRSRFAFEGPVAYIGNEYLTIKPKDIEDQDTFTGQVDWTGYTDRYFLTAVLPQKTGDAHLKLRYENEIAESRLVWRMDRLDPEKQGEYAFVYYMGPKSHKVLSQYDNSLKKSINFGFFDILAKPLLITMNVIHDVIPNYGVAIILLTILIKLIFWPLGTKSYKSMNEMKKVQPLMMEIREKYKNDKQRMNQEIMGLYKTYKVNPASGCLPLLVQMPIFFALYRMLYQAIELRHAPFVGWITDLSGPDRLFHFDFAIPLMEAPYGIPVLTLLMGASFLLQQKMTPMAGDPMQAKMMMLMPIFMTVLFINFPSGLVLYMFVNNIISMGQQYYTQKKFSR
ncbi:MAG: membrane protein insertase YidC [Desulfotignum sp.]|jgi:YidC/Oxa1 family membrane protein insertase|nr:membrane protein insertase YidC [Desulfotignum sp.]